MVANAVSSIRQGGWKLEYFEDKRVELHNLKNDIGEENNLAETKSEKAEELRELLGAWRKAVNAQTPTANPEYGSKVKKIGFVVINFVKKASCFWK